ncbi:MAG: hypothetical protein CL398_11740 [Acidiferrobacteraceae bacterium]|nr:hypothetical protein [Acidiferrobacteraceae bacterium]|tara:strand:+ start:185 stop:394 length:210 start_codon:yes stop_codon:yes gene_type:complete
MELSYRRTSYRQWRAVIRRYIEKLKSDIEWLEKVPALEWESKFKAGMIPSEGIAEEIGWADEEWLGGVM